MNSQNTSFLCDLCGSVRENKIRTNACTGCSYLAPVKLTLSVTDRRGCVMSLTRTMAGQRIKARRPGRRDRPSASLESARGPIRPPGLPEADAHRITVLTRMLPLILWPDRPRIANLVPHRVRSTQITCAWSHFQMTPSSKVLMR